MELLTRIDHVAITAADYGATLAFYDRIVGAEVLAEHVLDGRFLVGIVRIGGGVQLSIHQQGNGVDLVARLPTPGSADLCFRWSGTIEEAKVHLEARGVEIVDGPSPRKTSDGQPAHSVYFRDPDGNLIEFMAAD